MVKAEIRPRVMSTTEILCSEVNTRDRNMKRKDLAGDEAGNTRTIAPAYGKLVPIGHGNEALSVVSVGAKFFDMLQIYDRRAMNPQKYVGVQFGFEISHGIAEHMAFFAGADSHIIFFRANPADIRDGQEKDSAFGAKDQPVGIFLLGHGSNRSVCLPSLPLFPGMLQCDPQPLSGKGLQ